jgi:hypothetical protein
MSIINTDTRKRASRDEVPMPRPTSSARCSRNDTLSRFGSGSPGSSKVRVALTGAHDVSDPGRRPRGTAK